MFRKEMHGNQQKEREALLIREVLMKRCLYPLPGRFIRAPIGSKARNLRFLIKHCYAVPAAFVCPGFDFLDLDFLRRELERRTDDAMVYSVRSSADVEDGGAHSFAGQFKSILGVKGVESLLEAVKAVRSSAESPSVRRYMAENDIAKDRIRMAVIIQEMVQAVCSGVAFSKNPLTGFSEIIVEVWPGTGSGAGGEEPLRWVDKWGVWREKPEARWIPEEVLRKLVDQIRKIEKQYGQPVDVEWAYDGHILYFLQVRPITGIGIPVYSNAISKEMLPGIIKPLVWSVNTSLNNGLWVNLLKKVTGREVAKPEEMTGHFFGRAYFNMEVFGRVFEWFGMPRESFELLMGIEREGPARPKLVPGAKAIRFLPGCLKVGIGLMSLPRQIPDLEKTKKAQCKRLEEELSKNEELCDLLRIFYEVFAGIKPIIYFNVAVPLLVMAHHRMLERMLEKSGRDLQSVEIPGVTEATEENDPNIHLARLHDKYFKDGVCLTEGERRDLEDDVLLFLDQFGYHSDSNSDFSVKAWKETPDLIAAMIETYSSGGPSMTEEEHEENEKPRPVDGLKLRLLIPRIGKLAAGRETVSVLYDIYYGLFRTCFLKIGEIIARDGHIEEAEDVFYLYLEEIEALAMGAGLDAQGLVSGRKEAHGRWSKMTPSDLIFGKEEPLATPVDSDAYSGVPVSLGSYEGPAKVLMGLTEYEKLHDGDVLIIPYSDVGWTPLFQKAGAVVSESGGVLSHGSIMAREYGIPAVVSVKGACGISDNARVHVDGRTGIITVRS